MARKLNDGMNAFERQRKRRIEKRDFYLVQANCEKAKRARVPSTLTLDEWKAAISYFHGLCAYCQVHPYQMLEHFRSLPQGGTTADNCVPSCYACNNKKGSRTPDRLIEVFSQEVVNIVIAYLASQK
jgi:5-methylcytosine-specific restriction endonuclease McrA